MKMLFYVILILILSINSSIVFAEVEQHDSYVDRSTKDIAGQRRSKTHLSMISMSIALAQQNIDSAAEWLMEVSNPKFPNFSRYWSAAEIVEKFSPSQEALINVVKWLEDSGISLERLRPSRDRAWLQFNATNSEVEGLLNTAYVPGATNIHLLTANDSLPASIRKHIDFITPTTRLTGARTKAEKRMVGTTFEEASSALSVTRGSDYKTSDNLSKCSQYTTLDCLRVLYRIPTGTTAHPNNSYGIVELAWVSWLPQDLDLFFSSFSPQSVGQRPIMNPIDGRYSQDVVRASPFNAEADLDFEYAMPLVYPQKVINYQIGDKFMGGTINNLLAAFDKIYCGALNPAFDSIYPDSRGYNGSDCGNTEITNVISISYANDEVTYPAE
jgi:tripeptidyl-peptidase I